jgi:hypothetical protein
VVVLRRLVSLYGLLGAGGCACSVHLTIGLANDSPAARPSIFNDSEEFALLAPHDELLLRILYDRRLRTGRTIEEAKPIVQTIATELMRSGPV